MEFNGTFLATIITFIVFVFLMNKILYAPVLDIIEKRKNFVDTNYKDAQNNNTRTEELGREKEEKLAGAKDDARGKYISILDEFKNKKSDFIREAQDSAQGELDKAQADLNNLSNEVKKGMIEAAEEGHFPARVPIGYKNHRTSKKKTTILVDTDKAHFVIRAFELYSTGLYSYETLAQKLASEGFMIGKRKCYKRNIELILNNPFYMGEFNYKGKRYYDAKHTPLISKELFYTVQKIIHSKTSPHLKKHDFLYSGLIKSPNGYSLVGDIKKGKYIYYRSTDVKDKGLKLLKEEYVDEMVENMLKNLSCPPEFVENVMNTLKNILNGKEQYETNSLEEIQKKINILKKRLNQLYVDKLDGTISEEFYFDKHEEWQTELDELRVQFDYLSSESDEILDRAETILTLCKNAYSV